MADRPPGSARFFRSDDIAGEVALVTGGSRGLGVALARELARHSCRLLICARDGDELARAADDLPLARGRGHRRRL